MAHWNADNTWTTISNVDYPIIASPRFNDIVADDDGIMWIGTDHGLLRYDPNLGPDSLVRYDTSNTPMPANHISGVEIDPSGLIWLATEGGLVRFDSVAGNWNVWTTANGLPWGDEWPGWSWIHYLAVQPDAGGGFTVWFGEPDLLCELPLRSAGKCDRRTSQRSAHELLL